MATKLHTATAQGAIEYLDSLVAKNRAPASVVSPLKTALSKVLQRTEGENWGRTDLIELDVGDIMMRFKQLTLTEYSDGSYRTYEMRLKKAIGWYLKFLQTPGWAPESTRSSSTRNKPNDRLEGSSPTPKGAIESHSLESQDFPDEYSVSLPAIRDDAVTYPFPLESGKMASLDIPRDITATDVARLHIFLEALVIRREEGGGT
jgi:hypothetical protein